MNPRRLIVWMCLMMLCAPLLVSAQEPTPENSEDVGVRSAFLISRKKVAVKGQVPKVPKIPMSGNLGLGYSMYGLLRRAQSTLPVRVDPTRVFENGDAVRFVLEPNANGFLYVFYAENNQNPTLIFPDVRLRGGDNRVAAHVPYELPSSREPNPQFQWFHFGKDPAAEVLYFVMTRSPLPGIPIGSELVAYCRQFPGACPWKPPANVWSQVESFLSIPKKASMPKKLGQFQDEEEATAIGRSFGLTPDNADPSYILMNTVSDSSILIARVVLNHQ